MPERPNILIFVPHDLGRHLGCYGVETVHSDNIDRLAAQGVRFENSFCTAPQCSPSRASIFTGRYPHNNGVMGLTHADFAWDLYEDEQHLAGILSDAGWHCALMGGHCHETRRPEEMGFDRMLPGGDGAARADAAIEFFSSRRDADEPFFLEFEMSDTHRSRTGFGYAPDTDKGVYVPPYILDEFSSREDFAYMQGAVKAQDRAVGRVIDALDQTGMAEDTLVIFTADHGIPFPRAKCSLYDPGLEVPLILRWPAAGWTRGTVFDHMVSNVDYLPTILDLVGLPTPDNVQGRSLAPLLSGEPYEARAEVFGEMTYHDYCDPRRCIRTGTHKLIVNFTMAPFFMDPSQEWWPKCVTVNPERPRYAYHPPVELYDLRADPLEFSNLADEPEHADVRADLLARLHAWLQQTDDPLLEGIPVSPLHRMAWAALRDDDG